jgi:hypothetical protein
MQSSLEHAKAYSVAFFLGALAIVRKATISFVISIRPFVHMEQFGLQWTDFHEILNLRFFRKNC